ncbi:hypothetical protein ACJMK2_019452 [Sinanodonta woodiana]|uniref:Uncharacterized protein n=1 Tax=Sinanodonta woodiana TaxID=1069815 RepID=A0ABD3UJ87_SINWO
MTVAMAEWLDRYNMVSQKQQEYLEKIRKLRRSIQNKEEQSMLANIERMRTLAMENNNMIRYPTMSRPMEPRLNASSEPFPNKPCMLHDRKNKINFHFAPHVTPRKLEPIVKKKRSSNPKGILKKNDEQVENENISSLPNIQSMGFQMEKMKTDYESFESIAKRNKIEWAGILKQPEVTNSSQPDKIRRKPFNVSTITILEDDDDFDSLHPLAYSNDNSSRKSIVTIRGPDDDSFQR